MNNPVLNIFYNPISVNEIPSWFGAKGNPDISIFGSSMIDVTLYARVIITGIPAQEFMFQEQETTGVLTRDFLEQLPENSRGHNPPAERKEYDQLVDRIGMVFDRSKAYTDGTAIWEIPLEISHKEGLTPPFTRKVVQEYRLENKLVSFFKEGKLLCKVDLSKD